MTGALPDLSAAPARAGAVLAVDLAALVANWRAMAALGGGAECGAVIKADAYGLGVAPVSRALWDAGARTFFVAGVEAGLDLRAVLPDATVTVLHGVLPGAAGDLSAARITPILNTPGDLERWRDEAARLGRRLPCFVHFDTGMNRLGLTAAETAALIDDPARHLAGLDVQVWMTHLACADDPTNPMTAHQRDAFAGLLTRLPKARASLVNSAGIHHGANFHFDLLRPGIALTGANPTPWQENPMQAVARIFARIHQLREVPAGDTVGYDATYRTPRPTRIATLGMGYADGYPWRLAGKGQVAVAGHLAPIVARVSMDLLTVDVTDVPPHLVHEGGWVEVMGPHRTVDVVAQEAGTIPYEILTNLGRRYTRVYAGGDVSAAAQA